MSDLHSPCPRCGHELYRDMYDWYCPKCYFTIHDPTPAGEAALKAQKEAEARITPPPHKERNDGAS